MKWGKKTETGIKRRPRLVPRGDDGLRIVRRGRKLDRFSDLYVELLSMPWTQLAFLIGVLYFFSNTCFALIYYFNVSGIENARPHSFQDVFFFSIQTMATIGYGRMTPTSFFVNMTVAVEALWGFCFFAVTTALVFAKFSQPTAKVIFSDVAVISPYNGVPHLKLRMANQRLNRIVDASVGLTLLANEITQEGFRMRRFHDLPIIRSNVPLMQLSWTVMHPINEESPLYKITPEALEAMEAEIIVSLHGLDETLSQNIHARHSYVSDEIICNAFFHDVLARKDGGFVEVDYNHFHTVHKIEDKTSA